MIDSRQRSVLPRLAGEFLVIVLGVLVALGVDQWRENRADVRLEAVYYRSLVEDLERDIEEYEFALDFTAVSMRAADHVLATITGVPAAEPFPTLAEAVQYASWVNYPAWTSGTVDELVNSGTIRLVRNQEVKRAVLAYYGSIAEWKPRLQSPEFQAFIEYRRVTAAWLPFDFDSWTRGRSSPRSGDLATHDPELERKLRDNEEVLGLTLAMLSEWAGVRTFMQRFHDEAVALRDRIEAELLER